MKIILPRDFASINETSGPLFFLAGPVRGGGDWQYQCCLEIQKHIPDFYAVLPCRYKTDHPLMEYRYADVPQKFDRQLSWERHYLHLAATIGCIIFWLPCESKTDPHPGPEPYAMDTRGELAEWRGRLMYNRNFHVVVGAESEFFGLSQIQRNFNEALEEIFPIYESLLRTIFAAFEEL